MTPPVHTLYRHQDKGLVMDYSLRLKRLMVAYPGRLSIFQLDEQGGSSKIRDHQLDSEIVSHAAFHELSDSVFYFVAGKFKRLTLYDYSLDKTLTEKKYDKELQQLNIDQMYMLTSWNDRIETSEIYTDRHGACSYIAMTCDGLCSGGGGGVSALSAAANLLVYSNKKNTGEIVIKKLSRKYSSSPQKPSAIHIIASCYEVTNIAFADGGDHFATGDNQGIDVKVFDTRGQLQYTFARGITTTVIKELKFTQSARGRPHYLALCSERPTIHVFRLKTGVNAVEQDSSGGGYFGSYLSGWTPSCVTQYFAERRFAYVNLAPEQRCFTMEFMYPDAKTIHLRAFLTGGEVCTYLLDQINGGECQVVKSINV